MTPQARKLLRHLPSVTALLEHEEVAEWLHGLPRQVVVESLQAALQQVREEILAGQRDETVDVQDVLSLAESELVARSVPSLRRVINATGIVLHTGLGRAPLCEAAIDALVEGVHGYCNLEYDLESGQRGIRHKHVENLLTALTGAEAAVVVNNNAAATLLVLHTFARDQEVIVSRGELIEIGGSFRLPEIMAASGALLREVGTTNRTRLQDYESAINDRTAVLLRVHPSNYRVVGFTASTTIGELATLARQAGLIAVDDLGSGALVDFSSLGLPAEPRIAASLSEGADLVCFSGDKLLGGPQCGVIAGRRDLIEQIESSPLMRTYRVGKLTLLALEATLRCYQDADEAREKIPALAMLSATTETLAGRGRKLVEQLKAAVPGEHFLVCSDVGFAGGGAMPDQALQTVVVQWRPRHHAADDMATALRQAEVPVIARIRDDALCFDLRTVGESDFEALVSAVHDAVQADQPESPESRDGLSLPVM